MVMEEQSPWLCHICDRTSTSSDAVTCSECYKLTCRTHMTIATIHNPDNGLYQLVLICAHCQLKRQLS